MAKLRRRKAREAKPFAVMVANVGERGAAGRTRRSRNRALGVARAADRRRQEPRRPRPQRRAQLARRRPHARLYAAALAACCTPWRARRISPAGAMRANEIALVATSANVGGEPLVADDEDARRRLGPIADLVVTHGRAIVVRADDSVMRVLDGAPAYLRRARGFVPEPIDLGVDGPSVLAAGADLKNTRDADARARGVRFATYRRSRRSRDDPLPQRDDRAFALDPVDRAGIRRLRSASRFPLDALGRRHRGCLARACSITSRMSRRSRPSTA